LAHRSSALVNQLYIADTLSIEGVFHPDDEQLNVDQAESSEDLTVVQYDRCRPPE
jgi:hypothetical protein